jgi:hypothetical protein
MTNINDLVKRELISPSIDLATDYSNIAIDSLTDNDILGEIPFVKTIVAGTNIGLAIKEKFFVKKLLNFLSTLHKGEIEQDKFNKFKQKLEVDKNYKDKVLEVLIIMIDRHINVNQSNVMANLFKAHINGLIDWMRFNSLCIILDKLHPLSYQILYEMSQKTNLKLDYSFWGSSAGKPPEDRNDIYKFNVENEAILLSSGLITPHGSHFVVSPFGKDLFKFGILEIFMDIE